MVITAIPYQIKNMQCADVTIVVTDVAIVVTDVAIVDNDVAVTVTYVAIQFADVEILVAYGAIVLFLCGLGKPACTVHTGPCRAFIPHWQ